LPSVCGMVCFHPCETRCRRGSLDQPIAIRALKGAAVRFGSKAEPRRKKLALRTGKKVAVVGSGPAGLTAAYYLSKLCGHQVTIFEEFSQLGGMLRVGIPRYRLPAVDLDRDINIVRKAGVKIKTNYKVESVQALKRKGFDAVFLALGAHAGWDLGLEVKNIKGVIDCVELLRRVSLSKKNDGIGKRVAVVGGGNSAIDAARTVLRLGAEEVIILYRRSREEMPADEQEIMDALAEGAKLEPLVLPINISRNKSRLQVTCQRMQLGEMDSSGRRRPVPIPDSEYMEEFDTIVAAIGQYPAIPKKLEVPLGKGQRIMVIAATLQTELPYVFAGGDVVTGPASVVEAIAHGRQAAQEIDRYLGGSGTIDEKMVADEDISLLPPLKAESKARYRPEMPHQSESSRTKNFSQVELGYSRKAAIQEASRCLRCDLET